MRKFAIIFIFIFLTASQLLFADTIFFKDGTRLDVEKVWQEKDSYRCELYGSVVDYPKETVLRIEKGVKTPSETPHQKDIDIGRRGSWRRLSKKEIERRLSKKEIVYNSAWDGSVYQVKRYLKKNLNDPKSFDAMEWSPVTTLDDDVIRSANLKHKYIVRCKFRAKNIFGGYVINNMLFYLDAKGNVVNTKKW